MANEKKIEVSEKPIDIKELVPDWNVSDTKKEPSDKTKTSK